MTAKEQGLPALTPQQIEAGWNDTFSTNNPYCPCDLKSFTKAVRWAERQTAALASDTGERGVGVWREWLEHAIKAWPDAVSALVATASAMGPSATITAADIAWANEQLAALRAQPAGGGEVLDCGHHNSLMLKSAETGLPLYCELCDALTCARDNASDAADWRAKFGELQADDVARQWLDTMRDLLLPKHEGEWREFVAMVKATDSGVEFKECRTRTPPESGGQGDEHWPGVDKMLVAAYEHGLNSEPMDMIAMKARYAALAHPPTQASGAVTEAMVCKALGIPYGDAALIVRVDTVEQAGKEVTGRWLAHLPTAAALINKALAQGGGNER